MAKTLSVSFIQKHLAVLVMVIAMFLGMFTYSQPVQAAEIPHISAKGLVLGESTSVEAMLAQIQQLMQILVILQERVASLKVNNATSGLEGGFTKKNFSLGDRIQAIDTLKVRSRAYPDASLLGVVPPYAVGKIIGGPGQSGGYTWWQVRYDNGMSGWSADNWLKKVNESPTYESDNVYEVETAPSATCSLTTNKPAYIYGEDIKISWRTTGAEKVYFLPETEKDYLDISDKLRNSSGSMTVEASVHGNPTIVLKAIDKSGNAVKCTRTISIENPSVRVTVDGHESDSLTVDPEDSIQMYYFPRGDIESCRITGYYEDGKYSFSHEWNKFVTDNTQDGFGRASLGAVISYKGEPYGALESINVTCDVQNDNSVGKTISVMVQDSGAEDVFRFNYNGRDVTTSSNVTRTEAFNLCLKEIDTVQYNLLPDTGDTAKCYWGSEIIRNQMGWKG